MYEPIITHEGTPTVIKWHRSPEWKRPEVWLGRVWEVRRNGEVVGTIVYDVHETTLESHGVVLVKQQLMYQWTYGSGAEGWTAHTPFFSTAVARIIEDDQAANKNFDQQQEAS